MPLLDRFHHHLSLTNSSRTRARDEVFTALYHHGPMSSQNLITYLQEKVSRAGTYRIISRFLEIGVVYEDGGRFEVSDRFKQHYHNFTCRICGTSHRFNDPGVEQAINRLGKQRFRIEDHHVSLTGVCALCALSPNIQPRKAIGTNFTRPPGY